MIGRLPAYLLRRVGGVTLGTWLILTALLQALDMLDATSDILKRNLGASGVLHYALLTGPSELVLAIPLAALLGPLLGFYALARSQEIVAIRASGISLRRVALWLLPLPAVLGLVEFALVDQVVPRTETAMVQWWDATQPPQKAEKPQGVRWMHTDAGLVAVNHVSADAKHIDGLRVYQRDADGLMTARWTAAAAQWVKRRWVLSDVRQLRLSGDHLQREAVASRIWRTDMKPQDLLRLDIRQPHLSGTALLGVIAGQRVGSRPISYYRMALVRLFAQPLGVFILMLLAVPACRGVQRSGEGAGVLVAVLALGLAYVLCEGLLAAMGSAGRVAPLAAALVPLLGFFAIGLFRLVRADRL